MRNFIKHRLSALLMIKSLRYRLLAWFLIVTLVITGTVIPLVLLREKNEVTLQQTVNIVNGLHIYFLKDLKAADQFIAHEAVNPHFFITGESEYIVQHEKLKKQIYTSLYELPRKKTTASFELGNQLNSIHTSYDTYCQLFDSIVYYTYRRGYRDLGLLGELNSYAYAVENDYRLSTKKWNKIRNLEREYLYRRDTAIRQQVDSKCNILIADLRKGQLYNKAPKEEIIGRIEDYNRCFDELIVLDEYIGLNNESGLVKELNKESNHLELSLASLISSAINAKDIIKIRSNLIFGLIAFLLIALSVVFSIYLSKHILAHLENLTHYISNLTRLNFRYNQTLNLRNSSTEIRQIFREFRNMVAQLLIREKQRDEALLKAENNEKRFRELTDMLPQCVYETDALGNITYANNAWYRTFGYSREDIKEGLNLIEILNSKASQELFGEDKIENSEYTAIRKDSSIFPASVYSNTIRDEEKIIGRRGIIIDITLRNKYIEGLRKETQKAQISDRHKSSFLANMSHEIRTPMNTIIGFANLLSNKEVPDEEKTEFIRYIQSSGELLLNLIDDIIDIAKIEAGEIKINKESCYVNGLVKELHNGFKELKKRYNRDNIDLRLEVPKEKIVFKTDPYRLKQILSNLVSNAIKFTEKGSVTYGVLEMNQNLEFFIQDTGIGISSNELKTIFERFKRTVLTEHKKISGTGLGLAISKNLVEMLGGQMWVDSRMNQGTRFWFTLPYIKIEKEHIVKPLIKSNGVTPVWENKTFMIVEDDKSNYYFLKESLKKTKVRTIWAKDGEEAVELCKQNRKIDMILMDIQLPKINGYEATKRIKKELPNIPVIAQTAFAMEGDKEKSVLAGCNDYITKPIDIYDLFAKISQFIPPDSESEYLPASDGQGSSEKNEEITKNQFSLKDKN